MRRVSAFFAAAGDLPRAAATADTTVELAERAVNGNPPSQPLRGARLDLLHASWLAAGVALDLGDAASARVHLGRIDRVGDGRLADVPSATVAILMLRARLARAEGNEPDGERFEQAAAALA
jgi:hypothetical protein